MEQKKVVATLLVALLVLSQHGGLVEAKHCKVQCLLKCVGVITTPPLYGACITLCMLACQIPPPQPLMACTTECANNALKNLNHPDALDQKAGERFVDSCYNSCKDKN